MAAKKESDPVENIENKTVFDVLNNLNVNDHTEKVDNDYGKSLTYLSWVWAWASVKKLYPDVHYEIKTFDGLPYVFDEKTGYMVYTSVTIEGVTHDMWLPVMNSSNKAMKDKPYKYMTKKGEKTVEAATMFDVNKAIMRCLTKNLAMFGLGLYIYAGEDLPEAEGAEIKAKKEADEAESKAKKEAEEAEIKAEIMKLWEQAGGPVDEFEAWYQKKAEKGLTNQAIASMKTQLMQKINKSEEAKNE